MASPLKCDICENQATVHLTQIVDHKVHKVDLCEACAQAKGVTDPSGFSLSDLLLKASLNPESPAPSGLRCEHCGFVPEEFKKSGRLGCPKCYDALTSLVDPMLENMHKGTRHVGKVPTRALERQELVNRLHDLETNLASAIKAERYEDAARFRDEIVQVREEAGIPPTPSA
ncbi:MAG: UvrB/UvrC motif-containing protein [Synoicihabitans sp.]